MNQESIFCKRDFPMKILVAIYTHRKYDIFSFANICSETGIGKIMAGRYLSELEKRGFVTKKNFFLYSAKFSLTQKGSIVAKNLFAIQQSLKA